MVLRRGSSGSLGCLGLDAVRMTYWGYPFPLRTLVKWSSSFLVFFLWVMVLAQWNRQEATPSFTCVGWCEEYWRYQISHCRARLEPQPSPSIGRDQDSSTQYNSTDQRSHAHFHEWFKVTTKPWPRSHHPRLLEAPIEACSNVSKHARHHYLSCVVYMVPLFLYVLLPVYSVCSEEGHRIVAEMSAIEVCSVKNLHRLGLSIHIQTKTNT